MTTSWLEAYSNAQEYEEPDPVFDELDYRKDCLHRAVRDLGCNDAWVEKKTGPAGRDAIEDYAWTVTPWFWNEATNDHKSPRTFTGSYEQVLEEIRAYTLPEGYTG